MTHTTPVVEHGVVLNASTTTAQSIRVDTPAWRAWLDEARTFTYHGNRGTFTARKERGARDRCYWRAYRTISGQQYRAYLGKTEDLTEGRLEEIAETLAQRGDGDFRDGDARVGTPQMPARSMQSRREARATCSPEGDESAPGQEQQDSAQIEAVERTLLATKLRVPPWRAGNVHRPRLMSHLRSCQHLPLVVVAAPAGSGKTTLLVEWLLQEGPRGAWVSLDPSDNDPYRFWAHVVGAVEVIEPLRVSARAVLAAARSLPIDAVLVSLLNALADVCEPVTLVLDDYHVIANPECHRSVAFVLDHQPASLRIVLATRTVPTVPLGRLRASGLVEDITARDLQFSAAEVTKLFARYDDLDLTAQYVEELTSQTEGWVAGLQLAALALRGRDARADVDAFLRAFKSGGFHTLVDYLSEEVLDRQPPDMQRFLTCTSILDRLSAPLCAAVLGSDAVREAQGMLERIEKANLFLVPLDNERRWYRYHHLFATFLRWRLSGEGIEAARVARIRASEWYEHVGMATEAVAHALAAQDYERAARLIEGQVPAIEESGDLALLTNWLEQLPGVRMRERPHLCVAYAIAELTNGSISSAESHLAEAEAWVEQTAHLAPGSDASGAGMEHMTVSRALRGRIATARAMIAHTKKDYERAIQFNLQALGLTPPDQIALLSNIRSFLGSEYTELGDIASGIAVHRETLRLSEAAGYGPGMRESLFELGTLSLLQGKLRAAMDAFRRYIELTGRDGELPAPVAAAAYLYHARVLYEWDDLEGAARSLAASRSLNTRLGDVGLAVRCGMTQFRLKYTEGDLSGAQAAIRELEEIRDRPHHRATDTAAVACAWAYLILGDLAGAERWAEDGELTVSGPLSYGVEFPLITLARLQLAQGYPDRALPLLERLRTAASADGRVQGVIVTDVLRAQAFQACGDHDAAVSVLGNALAATEPEGHVRTFADEGPHVRALLSRLLRTRLPSGTVSHISLSYLKTLLQSREPGTKTESTPPVRRATGPLRMLLSDQEMAVMTRVAAGLSNREIADELVLAESTVKWHLQHVYSKLHANGRVQAITLAREVGLL